MTVNNRFEAYKLRRELIRSGVEFRFFRNVLGEFNEPTGVHEEVSTVLGLYHESNSFVSRSVGDGTVTRTRKQPMLLCLAEQFAEAGLEYGDFVIVDDVSKKSGHRVLEYIGAVDIADWGLIVDISFREVEDGN